MINKILRNYKNSYKFFIPFETFADDGIILNKNNGFQATFKVRFYDLDYVNQNEYSMYISRLNNAYKRLPDGYTIHFEVMRRKSSKYPSKDLHNSPIPTQIIEKVREDSIKNQDFYTTEMYITLTYIINEESTQKLNNFLNKYKSFSPKKIKDDDVNSLKNQFKNELVEFKNQLILFKNQFETASLDMKLLKDEELLAFLYNCINFENREKIKVPKKNEIMLDEYLTTSNIVNNENYSKINDEYIKSLTINAFPDEVFPRIFNDLENLNFEFRYTTRFIMLTKDEALKILKNYRIYYSMKIKSGLQWIVEAISKKEVENIDEQSLDKMGEAKYAEEELKKGNLAYGYYTFTFLIKDKNLEELEKKVQEVKKIVEFHDFTLVDDKYNLLDSLFGTIPGNIVSNIRKLPMNTVLLSSLMPISSNYIGNIKNNHFNDVCLFTTKTEKDLFYFNLHVNDIGHTLILGPTGAGKSTLLSFIAAEFLKYKYKKVTADKIQIKNSRVIFFDKDSSSRVLARCLNGQFYDLGNNTISFQPLKKIDTDAEKRQSLDWLSQILEQEKIEVTANVRNILWEALISLSNSNFENRTLTNFRSFVQDQLIRDALSFYCGSGAYAQYFDSNKEEMNDSDFIVFEMGQVVKEPKVIQPLLDYLFYKIEKEILDGTPTIIVLDECWLMLKNKKMSKKIDEWLKVLRKKNASVIFATQSLDDVVNASISSTIIDACKTTIFLANEKAISNWFDAYKKFNLNDVEIQTINDATMKQDYFLKNTYGSRLFSLDLSKTELAFVGSSDINDQTKIESIVEKIEKRNLDEKEKVKEINRRWLEYKNIDSRLFENIIKNY